MRGFHTFFLRGRQLWQVGAGSSSSSALPSGAKAPASENARVEARLSAIEAVVTALCPRSMAIVRKSTDK